MLKRTPPFAFSAPNGILSGRERGGEVLDRLMVSLRDSDPDGVTPLDFSEVDFIDISCADEFLTKLLMRIGSGELGTRYVFIQGANLSVRETLEAVCRLRNLAVLCKEGERVDLLGTLKTPIREALDVMLRLRKGTSSEFP